MAAKTTYKNNRIKEKKYYNRISINQFQKNTDININTKKIINLINMS